MVLEDHLPFMDKAVEQAQTALDLDEVPVGCIFVKNGEIIATGHNDTNRTRNGTRHAELCAIDAALAKNDPKIFENASLYVTVEPCIMCASALRQMKIACVYFGAGNERFGGNGSVISVNSDNTVESKGTPYKCYPDLRRREAIMLLRKFYTKENATAPEPKNKKQRVVKEDIPPLNFQLYLSKQEFIDFYGEDHVSEYESGESYLEI